VHVIGHDAVRNNVEAMLLRGTHKFLYTLGDDLVVNENLLPAVRAKRQELAVRTEVREVRQAADAALEHAARSPRYRFSQR
jgi:hypothetical protein